MTAQSDAAAASGHSYGQILRSTLLIGGSSAISVIFAVIRNKAIAAMLGPEGIGLFGLYTALLDIVSAIAGAGIGASGIRQIAEVAADEDQVKLARRVIAVKMLSLVLALAGAFLLVLFSLPVSKLTFGNDLHHSAVALLSIALLLRLLAGGQTAVIQGLRDISGLAMINIIGALSATLITLPLVFALGLDAVVPSFIASASAMLVVAWLYRRRLSVPSTSMSGNALAMESAALLRLGLVFMVSGVLTFGAAYIVRIIVLHLESVEAMGLYQAAWAIGGLYGGFILQAMGTDFYPRLTGVANDHPNVNKLVNEQIQISILLAGPGVVITLAFAPLIMQFFYAVEFSGGTDLLRLICLGMLLRIISWPAGYIVVAKGAQALFLWTEIAATVVHLGLAWILVDSFGVAGAGAAFLGLYIWHTALIYFVVHRLTGFTCSLVNQRLSAFYLMVSGVVLLAGWGLPHWGGMTVGACLGVASGLYALRTLAGLVPATNMPRIIRKVLTRLG